MLTERPDMDRGPSPVGVGLEPKHRGPERVLGSHAVRSGRSIDVAWMLPLWTAMMRHHESQDDAFALADDAPRIWQQGVWDMMARQDQFVFVLPPIGFCNGWVARLPAIYHTREVGLLSEICVAPEHERRGIGRALFQAAQRWFAARDIDTFQLATAMFNGQGQKFFAALGGRPILKRYQFAVSRNMSKG